MESVIFDTLAYANRLKAVGVPDPQAEVQAQALVEIIEGNLATKRDIKELEVTLRHDIKEGEIRLETHIREIETTLRHDIKEIETALRHDIKEIETALRHDIETLSYKLTIRLGGMLVVGIGVLTVLVKLL